jgi:hypothetical protein
MVSTVVGQPTATDLSYYPLHPGNVWLYKVYIMTQHGEQPYGWREDRIIGDTLLPNGKRYFVFNNRSYVRMDSATGHVFKYHPYYHPRPCLDSSESEIMNVTVHADSLYLRCGDDLTWAGWRVRSLPLENIGELYLYYRRAARQWLEWFHANDYRYAQGIGLYYFKGPYATDEIHTLYYAHINGTDYWPVEFRSFTAAALSDGSVHLRWRTENEVQNSGFTVQRGCDDGRDDWLDLAFVAAAAKEGQGADYEYTDRMTAAIASPSRLLYRLRQSDYDGSVAYSDVITVELIRSPDAGSLNIWPNPADIQLSIHVGLDAGENVLLLVSDLLGREVRRYENVPGAGIVTWDLHGANGLRVPSGLYRITLVNDGQCSGRTEALR